MGNWTITIKGIGPKPYVREVAGDFVTHLSSEGQNILSAEFISDTPEHSANLLADRDAKAAEFTPAKDGGLGYAKPEPTPEPVLQQGEVEDGGFAMPAEEPEEALKPKRKK